MCAHERESETEIESVRVCLTERSSVIYMCVRELGQADNSMVREAAADKLLLLLGVTRPC